MVDLLGRPAVHTRISGAQQVLGHVFKSLSPPRTAHFGAMDSSGIQPPPDLCLVTTWSLTSSTGLQSGFRIVSEVLERAGRPSGLRFKGHIREYGYSSCVRATFSIHFCRCRSRSCQELFYISNTATDQCEVSFCSRTKLRT